MGDASGDDNESRPSDTMRERVPESSRKFWLLLGADRSAVAAGIVGVIFLVLVAVGQLHPAATSSLFGQGDPLETLFQGLLTSIITGVTLVLTLNQLVLSQELGPIGDQRERMTETMAFRRDVEDEIEAPVSPAQPSAFLRSLVTLTQERAATLQGAVTDIDDATLTEQVEQFVDSVDANADAVAGNLSGSQFGEFDVVFSALNYNYSWKLYTARRIRAEYAAVLTDDADDALADLIDALELFGPAREHFKTLYFRWALIDLSRLMLYTSIPALLTAVTGTLYFDPGLFPGSVLGLDTGVVVISGAVAVSLLPFALLLSYILRIVTVTKRTLSIGPFILRETDRSRDFDLDDTVADGGQSGSDGDT